jgi:hypothetical protein
MFFFFVITKYNNKITGWNINLPLRLSVCVVKITNDFTDCLTENDSICGSVSHSRDTCSNLSVSGYSEFSRRSTSCPRTDDRENALQYVTPCVSVLPDL